MLCCQTWKRTRVILVLCNPIEGLWVQVSIPWKQTWLYCKSGIFRGVDIFAASTMNTSIQIFPYANIFLEHHISTSNPKWKFSICETIHITVIHILKRNVWAQHWSRQHQFGCFEWKKSLNVVMCLIHILLFNLRGYQNRGQDAAYGGKLRAIARRSLFSDAHRRCTIWHDRSRRIYHQELVHRRW